MYPFKTCWKRWKFVSVRNMNLMLEYSPFNFLYKTRRPGSSYDVFTKTDIDEVFIWRRKHCFPAVIDLLFVVPYSFQAGWTPHKNSGKQYQSLIPTMKVQRKKRTVSNLRKMISSTSGILETICNIHLNLLYIVWMRLIVHYFSGPRL